MSEIGADVLLEQGLELQRYFRDGWCGKDGEPLAALSTQHAASLAHAWRQLGHSSDAVIDVIEAVEEALLEHAGTVSAKVFSNDPVPVPLRERLVTSALPLASWLATAVPTLRRMRDFKALLVHLAATYDYLRREEEILAVSPRRSDGRALRLNDRELWLLLDDPRPPELDDA